MKYSVVHGIFFCHSPFLQEKCTSEIHGVTSSDAAGARKGL